MRPPSIGRSVPVIVSNLIPLSGVFVLDWSVSVLLGVFVLELYAHLWWTAVKVPFARKRSPNTTANRQRFGRLRALESKRGSVRLSRWLPPIYPRNVPLLVVLVCVLAPLEMVVAFVLFALTDPTVTPDTVGTILLGGLGVFCAQGVDTWLSYVRDGGYRTHSARSLVLTPFKHLFGIGLLFILVVTLVGSTTAKSSLFGPQTAIVTVLVGKLGWELHTTRRRVRGDRTLFELLYGSKDTEIEPVPVQTPDGPPLARVSPRRWVARVDALARGIGYAFTYGWWLVYPPALLVGLAAPLVGVGVALVVALPVALGRGGLRYLQYGRMEYRIYDDVVVAYDTWLSRAQKRVSTEAVSEVRVEQDFVGRCFDTATVTVDTPVETDTEFRLFAPEDAPEDDANDDRPITMVQVDPDPVVETLRGSVVTAALPNDRK